MAKISVEIVTPDKRVLQTQADEVIVPGSEGLFGVRPGHTAFLSLMDAGPLTLRDGGSSKIWFVAGGFVQVSNDRVLVLADHAEDATGIDVNAARRRLDEAQGKLRSLQAGDPQVDIEQAVVRRETARMAVAGR